MARTKIPSTPGAVADQLYRLIEQRRELEAKVRELKEQETALKEYLLENLPEHGAEGIVGRLCRVNIIHKTLPIAEDWEAVHAWVRKHASKGGFAILQKRLNQSAVKEILDSGKTIPGIGIMEQKDLSIRKK